MAPEVYGTIYNIYKDIYEINPEQVGSMFGPTIYSLFIFSNQPMEPTELEKPC
jgi:hypothetical protein